MRYLIFMIFLVQTAKDQSDWQEAYRRRGRTERIGMNVLGGWAVANMAVSGVGMSQTSRGTRAFHQMSFYWNAVNAGIVGLGYINLAKARKRNTSPTLSKALEA